MDCSNKIHICAFSHQVCTFVGRERECPNFSKCPSAGPGPTVAEVLELYRRAVPDRVAATANESLSATLALTERMVARLLAANGMDDSVPFSSLNRRAMAKLADELRSEGLSPATVKSYLVAVQRLGAAWVQRICEELGREIRPIPMPDLPAAGTAYSTPPSDRLVAVKVWYNSLAASPRRRLHAYAMLMYHFGMRNGDVDRLKWSAISEERGRTVLSYVPHKTRLKSPRTVRIEVCDVDAHHLRILRGSASADDFVISGGGSHHQLRADLNRCLRELGFSGSKGSYELRKMCADEYARRHGVDTAKAVLGHTLVSGSTAHYVDPSSQVVPTIW